MKGKILCLFSKGSSHVDGASHGASNHRVVTDSEESHHLNVSRN